MYRKTFEIFSKWIGKENNITIQFDQDHDQACADMQNNILHLPKDIANAHAHKAIALTMHEAAHVRHSRGIPIKEVAPMKTDFEILNAIEDIRIDLKNFNVLPNIVGFYEELYKGSLDLTKKDARTEYGRRLCAGIVESEGFRAKLTREDSNFMRTTGLSRIMRNAGNYIDRKDWRGLKNEIQNIKQILKIDPNKDQPNTQTQITIGSGQVVSKGQGADGQPVDGTGDGKDKGTGAGPEQQGEGQGNPWAGIGTGPRMAGGSLTANPLAMDEQCANEFKEILNVKEVRTIRSGSILDTGNLSAYHTGDIEELFKEERTIRKKKSKIMFLIDSSGSMADPLMDHNSRASVVKSSVMRLTQILNEVRELEGINVDWAVSQFSSSYQSLTKENWEREYYPSGGTNFYAGFAGAMEDMLKDFEVEGKRIIVVFSDGDVNESHVEAVQKMVNQNHSDVRSLIVGVGSNLQGNFVKDLVGDNVIIAQDNATEIIIQTIRAML